MNTTSLLLREEIPVLNGFGRREMWHAHLDVKGEGPLTSDQLGDLDSLKEELNAIGLSIDDQPFCRFLPEEMEAMLGAGNNEIAALLARSDLYGAPAAHWTCKTTHADHGEAARAFVHAFSRIAEVAKDLKRPAYVEVERVRRVVVKSPPAAGNGWPETYEPMRIRPFKLVTLQELGRQFRDTEVHITVERLTDADPRVFEDLFQHAGFRIAYRSRADGGIAIVATAQGFEPDISRLFVASLDWAKRCQEAGTIKCNVVIKVEEIVWHYLVNDPWMLPVIRPGSLEST